eukprot:SAG31_NODE_298_length_18125_cov_27.373350_12_plen_196_part_00
MFQPAAASGNPAKTQEANDKPCSDDTAAIMSSAATEITALVQLVETLAARLQVLEQCQAPETNDGLSTTTAAALSERIDGLEAEVAEQQVLLGSCANTSALLQLEQRITSDDCEATASDKLESLTAVQKAHRDEMEALVARVDQAVASIQGTAEEAAKVDVAQVCCWPLFVDLPLQFVNFISRSRAGAGARPNEN